jgi:hypothetical protein
MSRLEPTGFAHLPLRQSRQMRLQQRRCVELALALQQRVGCRAQGDLWREGGVCGAVGALSLSDLVKNWVCDFGWGMEKCVIEMESERR